MDIQAPEISYKLARALGAFGPGVLRACEEVVFPVIVVDDIREQGTGSARRAFGHYQTIGPIAGQLSYATFTNPVDSGVLIYPHTLALTGTTSQVVVAWDGQVAPPGVAVNGYSLHESPYIQTRSRATLSMNTDATGPILYAPFFNLAMSTTSALPQQDWLRSLVLRPGHHLNFIALTTNATMNIAVLWEEDPA